MTILPLAYLPSVEYFWHLSRGGCVVDLGEHFVKRSERNRTRILATDGVMELTAHVRHANRPGQPYFDHYALLFEPFYRRSPEFLADLDLGLLEVLCRQARIPMPALSERYVEAAPGDTDLRPKHREGPAFIAEPYYQVFSDRMPFEANLSFADLLFAEGPEAVSVLARCRQE